MGTKIYPSVNHHVITVVELNEQSNMNIFHCRLLSVSKHFVPWVSDTSVGSEDSAETWLAAELSCNFIG